MSGYEASTSKPLVERQEDEPMLDLLRAMFVVHGRARRLSAARLAVTVVVAGSGAIATVDPRVAPAVTTAGAIWATLYSLGLASWASRQAVRGATIQEMFDRKLYGFQWNKAIADEPIGHEDINGLAAKYRGAADMIKGYYEVPLLPQPYDVAACQLQNLGWGSRVRRRYARLIVILLTAWAIAGLSVGVAMNLTVFELLLRWYIPALGALLLGLDTYRSQQDVVRERERAIRLLRDAIEKKLDGEQLRGALDRIQDVIFLTRRHHVRVPEIFFKAFRSSDRADFNSAVSELAARVERVTS
ncbi:S-4TM family putative pore-forming effector [Micromonospora matsumotoense]|uniref:S-4TM family putative pore-forming effector n=1 Tax=Micromonospora matsumotoense TaxID=121616 RepID=UPI0033FA8EC2